MSKKKLAGLFNNSEDEDGEILTYAAPKVPQKPRTESSASNSDSIVLKACAVSCFRLIDGQYKPYGKLGCAVLFTQKKRDCRLILYAARDKQVAFAQLHVNFAFTITSNNYASFYDSTNHGWSVLFDSDTSLSDFAAHVCLGKFFCSDQSGILTQDITSGDGSPLQVGDTAEVRYIGRLVEGHKLGREFDSNKKSDKLFRFKLGAKKVVAGWEEGVINMMKGGRRIIVIPPSKGYGDKGVTGRIPASSVLVFDITVIRVKHSRVHSDSSASDKASAIDTIVDTPPLPNIPVMSPDVKEDSDDEGESTVKSKTRSIVEKFSISESGSPVKNQNAKLIARMAKMGGQAVLPGGETGPPSKYTSESPVDADSPVDHNDQSHVHRVAHPKPQHPPTEAPVHRPSQFSSNPSNPPVYEEMRNQTSAFHPTVIPPTSLPPTYPMQQPVAPTGYPPNSIQSGQLVAYQPQASIMAMQHQQMGLPYGNLPLPQNLNQTVTALSQTSAQDTKKDDKTQDIHTAMLVSETRQQNTEVRVAISKLQDKVDKVWERMSDLKGASGPSYPSVESGTLLQNITRIIQENERLKQDVIDFSGKAEKQNEKISELLQKNQMFMESSNRVLELKNDDFKASATQSQQRVLDLEQDKLHLTKQLSELTGEVTQLQCLVNEYKKSERELKDKLVTVTSTVEDHKDEMASLRAKVDETSRSLLTSQMAYKDESNAKRKIQELLESSEEEAKTLHQKLTNQEQENIVRITALEENTKKLNSEIDKTRKEYEKEIDSLREKLREERAIGFSEKSLELNKMEEEMTEQWKAKCERLVRGERERLSRQIKEVEEEKRRAEVEVEQYEGRIEIFRSKALEMKQRFKDEIDSLKDELEEAQSREREMDREELIKEVRRLMNQIFHAIRQKVMADRRYRGERVLDMLKGTIRRLTLRLMGQDVSSSEEESESDDEAEMNELKTMYQSEISRLRQSIVEQQKQVTSLEGRVRQQLQQHEIDQNLIADKEASLTKMTEENRMMAASIRETAANAALVEVTRNDNIRLDVIDNEVNLKTAAPVEPPVTMQPNDETQVEDEKGDESSSDETEESSSEEESSDHTDKVEEDGYDEEEERKRTEIPKPVAEEEHTPFVPEEPDSPASASLTSSKLDEDETDLLPRRISSDEEEKVVPDTVTDDKEVEEEDKRDVQEVEEEDKRDVQEVEEEDKRDVQEVEEEDKRDVQEVEETPESPLKIDAEPPLAAPVKQIIEEITNPFSGGLTPPPLSSPEGSSCDEEEGEQSRKLEDSFHDAGDGDGADFLTPPSGGDESETKDSPEKKIDSSDFDVILTRENSNPASVAKVKEAESTVDVKEKAETTTLIKDKDNVPLFGDDSDDDYDGIFGTSKKTVEESGDTSEVSPPKENAKVKKEDLSDDKPKPPPLFDDDDDDYDLFK